MKKRIIIYINLYYNLEHFESLNDANTDIGLEVNTEITKYMLLLHHQNAGQNHDIKVANRSFGNVAQLRMIITNQNLI
jgi:hypothetical protein